MRSISIDFETRSTVDLTDVNAYVYFDDPTTEAICMAYCFDDDRPNVGLWWNGSHIPQAVAEHIHRGGILNAWNAAFERLCFAKLMGPRHGWPVPKIEQWRCTMAAAYAMALPGKLEMAAPALGLDIRKDDAGHRLMLQMSKPRRFGEFAECRRCRGLGAVDGEMDYHGPCIECGGRGDAEYDDIPVWWDDLDRMERLGEYCRQDVRTEMAVASRLLPLTESEQQVWYLDQKINDRGVGIDERLCLNAREVVREAARRLDAELREITGHEATAATNTGAIRKWLGKRGVPTDSIAKDVLAEMLVRDDLPTDVRRVLEIRRDGGKSSTAKIDAMLVRRQADGRMRGNLQYHGASTGRWAARGAQLQNLPRPSENGMIPGVVNATIGILLED